MQRIVIRRTVGESRVVINEVGLKGTNGAVFRGVIVGYRVNGLLGMVCTVIGEHQGEHDLRQD